MFRINEGYFQRLNPNTQQYESLVEADLYEIDSLSGQVLASKNGRTVLVGNPQSDDKTDESHNWFTVVNEKGEAVGVYRSEKTEEEGYQNVKLGLIIDSEVNYQWNLRRRNGRRKLKAQFCWITHIIWKDE